MKAVRENIIALAPLLPRIMELTAVGGAGTCSGTGGIDMLCVCGYVSLFLKYWFVCLYVFEGKRNFNCNDRY